MRFGAFVPQGWRMDLTGIPVDRQWDTMVSVARVAEEVGFESVWVYDHFHTSPRPSQEPTFEAWTVMAGLAEATAGVRLGQMCTSVSYRMPSYLAKVASCIDVMSGGRLEVGIGAGWYEHEYRGYGYPFPKAAARIGQLDEAVQILLAMWTEDRVTFSGEHYTLVDAFNRPKPLQEPHPPLWIAGGGEQLTLNVVARFADYANFAGDVEAFRHKRSVLAGHCARVGRDPAEITLSRNWDVVVAETEQEVEAKLAGVTGDAAALRRRGLVGTPDQIAERLTAWEGEGLAYSICYFPDATHGDGMRIFGEQVIPRIGG